MNIVHLTDSKFAEIYNDVDVYPTLRDVAEATALALKTVKNKATIIRRRNALDPRAPDLIYRNERAAPMSEDADKFMEDWGPERCCEELRRVAEMDLERVVTRNYFRTHSLISESTWNRYFGTFEEFKRQAGVKLSRQAHGLERNIAKHASVDHYRKVALERRDWGDAYIRENGARFKTVLVCNDLHDVEIDPFYLRVLIDTAKRVQPDVLVFNGDIFDLAEFGRFEVDPREWDVVGRIRFVHDRIMRPLRETCPDTQFDFIEGNHEARMLRLMADATPALRAVLSDLHGMTTGKLLGLEEFEINYIAKADLSAFTKREANKEIAKNYKIYWNTLLFHHFPHARNMGLPGSNGHHHKHQVWPMFSPVFKAYEWHQIGSGHKRDASFCEGEQWHNGFALWNIDTHNSTTSCDYIPVTDFAVAGGKWYHRAEGEGI